jgi:hypothetical protein
MQGKKIEKGPCNTGAREKTNKRVRLHEDSGCTFTDSHCEHSAGCLLRKPLKQHRQPRNAAGCKPVIVSSKLLPPASSFFSESCSLPGMVLWEI